MIVKNLEDLLEVNRNKNDNKNQLENKKNNLKIIKVNISEVKYKSQKKKTYGNIFFNDFNNRKNFILYCQRK